MATNKKINTRQLCSVFALICLSVAQAIAQDETPNSGIQWKILADYDSIYPSVALCTATIQQNITHGADGYDENYIGDPHGQIGCKVLAPSDDCPFILTISSERYITKTVLKESLPKKGQTYRIYPKLLYRWSALKNNTEPDTENITFSLSIGGRVAEERTIPLAVRSTRDCLLGYKDYRNRWVSSPDYLAAYVNEDHPKIDQILNVALGFKIVPNFVGYQKKSIDVRQQILAIWMALEMRGIKYSNITTTSLESPNVCSQYVRFFGDSINNGQANCVDGSVLIASVLRKIGLHTFLVIRPGHCYVGVAMENKYVMGSSADQSENVPIFIETTLLGKIDPNANPQVTIGDALDNFCQATEFGGNLFIEDLPHLQNNEPGYYIVDIDSARKKGYRPISAEQMQ